MIARFAHTRIHQTFYITLSFIFGIISQLCVGHVHIAGLIPLLLLTVLTQPAANRLFFFFVLTTGYITGGLCLQWQKYEHHKLYRYAAGQNCDIVARVTDLHCVDHVCFNCCIMLQTLDIKHHATKNWSSKEFTVAVYIKRDHDLKVGDVVALNNLVFKAPPTTTTFDDYLTKEGIHATLFLYEFDYTLIDRPASSLQRTIFELREKLHTAIKQKMSYQTYMLFSSIFLGNKFFSKKSFEHTKEHFTTWGVTHYLARSGLHMVIFVMSWYFLLNLLPLHFIIKELIILLISICYCLLSWPSISFIRAFLAFILYKIGVFFGRQTDVLHILSIVCLVILLLNPIQLFFLDFQLSFGLTCALAYFNQLQQHIKNQSPQTIA